MRFGSFVDRDGITDPAYIEGMSEKPGRNPDDGRDALMRDFFRFLKEREDSEDAEDADLAWEEPGESVPLEVLEAEFGRK